MKMMLRVAAVSLAVAVSTLAAVPGRADDGKKPDESQDLGTFHVGSGSPKVDLGEEKAPAMQVKPSGPMKLKRFKPRFAPMRPNMSKGGSKSGETPQIRQPVALSTPAPEYPETALQNRLEGYVVISYTIDDDGDTTDISIDRSQPAGVFDEAARRAVAQWEFKPYSVDGDPKPKRVRQKIGFSLPKNLGKMPDARGAAPKLADRGPVPTATPAPSYPPRAAQRHINGYVIVEFTVTPAGETSDINVLESHPAHLFNRAAARAVARWRFKPAIENGKPVSRRVQQRIDFSLGR